MFFDDSLGSIRAAAFEPVIGPALPSQDPPNFMRPSQGVARAGENPQQLFSTFARLASMVKVTPCYRTIDGILSVSGLLLEYKSGRRESVGQVRLDQLGDALPVEPEMDLWLGSRRLSGQYNRIVSCAVDLSCPAHEDGVTFSNYNWQGMLEWRTSDKQDIVFHRID